MKHAPERRIGFRAEAHRGGPKQATKPGKHGTLHLWRITYKDTDNPEFGEDSFLKWAYDKQAAWDAFNEQVNDDGESWEIVKIEPVLDTGPNRLSKEARAPRVVRDFNTLDDLIQHAVRDLGATHAKWSEHGEGDTKLYFPRKDGRYDEASVWKKAGYWHAQGPGSREIVSHLPRGAQDIQKRVAEARRPRRSSGPGTPVSPDDIRRAVSMYTPAKVYINGKYQVTGTITPTHGIEAEAATVMGITPIGGTIEVKQGENVWSFTRTEHGLTKATHRFEDVEVRDQPQFKLGAPRPGTSVRDYIAAGKRDRRRDQYEYPEDLRKGDIIYGSNGQEYEVMSNPVETGNGTVQIDLLINGIATQRFFDIGMGTIPIKRRSGAARETEARAEARRGTPTPYKIATDVSAKVGGTKPTNTISPDAPGAWFRADSPEYGQPIVVFVSIVDGNNIGLDIYADESTSNRYENISTFLYGPDGYTSKRIDVKEMVDTVQWVQKTVDDYARSWEEDQPDVDEPPAPKAKRSVRKRSPTSNRKSSKRSRTKSGRRRASSRKT